MDFNIYNSLILAGIIQGFIFTIVVIQSKKYRTKSTLLLAGLIAVYSLGNLQYILPDIRLMSVANMYKYAYLPFATLVPVLIYFYVIKFLDPKARIKNKKYWLLPFGLALTVTIIYRVLFLFEMGGETIAASYGIFIKAHEVFSVVYSLFLVPLALSKVISSRKKEVTFNRKHIRPDIQWLKYTLIFILSFTIIWGYLTYKNIFVPGSAPDFYVLWIGIAIAIYWLGYMGIYKYGILSEREKIRAFSGELMVNRGQEINKRAKHRYNSNAHIINMMRLLEEEKLYLDPHLSLDKLAQKLGISSSYLSRIIHKEMDTNFPDFINTYRIEEAKRYLSNPNFSNYTTTAIGLEAGFNSRSSFYAVFKKITGQTPASFKKLIRNQKIA